MQDHPAADTRGVALIARTPGVPRGCFVRDRIESVARRLPTPPRVIPVPLGWGALYWEYILRLRIIPAVDLEPIRVEAVLLLVLLGRRSILRLTKIYS
jgi:hypothetical protein